MGIYYNYREIDGYQAPIRVILSRRGLGKTFGAVMKGVKKNVSTGKRFVYVVETEEMIDELSQNRGEKFFAGIMDYLEKKASVRERKLLAPLIDENSDAAEVTEGDTLNHIRGGVIKVAGNTAGYIVAFNSFAKLKRNNFRDIAYIIIDEFIPETIDIRSLRNAYKIVSLVQSIARLQNVIIYMLANSVRANDIVLERLHLSNLKPGEIRVIKDEYGPLVVGQMVNNSDYSEFDKEANKSVAGRLAALMKEDNLERNDFNTGLKPEMMIGDHPKQSSFIACIVGINGESFRIHVTKDLNETYILEDYGKNIRSRFCVDQKFATPNVFYRPEYRDYLLAKYEKGRIRFDTPTTFMRFKMILRLEA